MKSPRKFLAAGVLAAALAVGAASPATAQLGGLIGTPGPVDERCKVPPLLWQAAAVVDPDSLEGCNFFEDPNYHENRKAAGVYVDNGVFSVLFG